ncbi:MAG: hypothetical protein WCJ19_02595 [bacterium]
MARTNISSPEGLPLYQQEVKNQFRHPAIIHLLVGFFSQKPTDRSLSEIRKNISPQISDIARILDETKQFLYTKQISVPSEKLNKYNECGIKMVDWAQAFMNDSNYLVDGQHSRRHNVEKEKTIAFTELGKKKSVKGHLIKSQGAEIWVNDPSERKLFTYMVTIPSEDGEYNTFIVTRDNNSAPNESTLTLRLCEKKHGKRLDAADLDKSFSITITLVNGGVRRLKTGNPNNLSIDKVLSDIETSCSNIRDLVFPKS